MKKYKGLIFTLITYITIANMVAIPIGYILNVHWYGSATIATIVTLTILFVDTFIRTLAHVIAKSK